MLRPFLNINEFKAVTGFKLGDVITMRYIGDAGKKELVGIFNGYETIERKDAEPRTLIYIGNCSYSINKLVDFSYLSTGGYQPFGVEYETESEEYDDVEVKYHFEENGVYQAENGEVFTIHKRIEVDGVDWVVFRPDSKHGDLLIRVIFCDGESECFLAENEHGEALLCEARDKVDEVKKGDWDEEQLDKEIADEKENDDDF